MRLRAQKIQTHPAKQPRKPCAVNGTSSCLTLNNFVFSDTQSRSDAPGTLLTAVEETRVYASVLQPAALSKSANKCKLTRRVKGTPCATRRSTSSSLEIKELLQGHIFSFKNEVFWKDFSRTSFGQKHWEFDSVTTAIASNRFRTLSHRNSFLLQRRSARPCHGGRPGPRWRRCPCVERFAGARGSLWGVLLKSQGLLPRALLAVRGA